MTYHDYFQFHSKKISNQKTLKMPPIHVVWKCDNVTQNKKKTNGHQRYKHIWGHTETFKFIGHFFTCSYRLMESGGESYEVWEIDQWNTHKHVLANARVCVCVWYA